MDERNSIEIVAEASFHLKQFRDLMNSALPDGWAVSVVGFEEVETRHGFVARLFDGDALDASAMLETVVALAQRGGGNTNAIH